MVLRITVDVNKLLTKFHDFYFSTISVILTNSLAEKMTTKTSHFMAVYEFCSIIIASLRQAGSVLMSRKPAEHCM